jgi:2-polyprenyl-6-methoxyphenol hydroxylase-like FAD-dependent oxidoreductase
VSVRRLDRRGRIALVGDAGYGPSPLSGQGASLGLVGAYVLAGELARAGGEHTGGFAAYQCAMDEYVQLNQQLALGSARRGTTRFANWRAVQPRRLLNVLPWRRRMIELAMRPPRRAADGIELPHYGALVREGG